ncbi:hypothetical protein S245_028880, partial [Arachis hypogaea]
STPSLVPPNTLELAGELSPSLSFSCQTTCDAIAGWSFKAHSVSHSTNVSDSQQWKHSHRARLLPPSRSVVPPSPALSLFLPPSPALRFQHRHPSLHLKLFASAIMFSLIAKEVLYINKVLVLKILFVAPLKRMSSLCFDEKLFVLSLYKFLVSISETAPIILYIRDIERLVLQSP